MAIKMTNPVAAQAEKAAASSNPQIPSRMTKDVYQEMMSHPAYKANLNFAQKVDQVRRNSIGLEQREYEIQLRNAALGQTNLRGGK
ncbi:hypothetical protein H9X98_07040 [Aeromonas jandaei]|uniref:hypothetical protein n=1 Tax=Aeromonas jandaei TaxID=650 RepID=UPI001F319AAD|nr:hypothetical protein [Aeromonas jandaei]MCF7717464.1 hypothetical protein [Aeromonas jandaei]